MNADTPTIPSHILNQAGEWLARRDVGLSPAEEAEFQRWLLADSRNSSAWVELSGPWQALDQARESGEAAEMIQELSRRKYRRRWKTSLAIASSMAAAVIVVLLVRPDANRGLISRTEQRVLGDGSIVELDRGAAIDVNFQPALRSVKLLRGQALFTVTKNPARPFVVSTDRVEVRAVGTAFSVQAGAEAVDVIVTEGRVAVQQTVAASDSADPVLVGAGHRLLMPAEATRTVPAVEEIAPAEINHRLAWRGPRLELSGTRLVDAIELINRESRTHLHVADSKLGKVQLSGIFRADDAEGFARLLEANYGMTTERHEDVIELRAK